MGNLRPPPVMAMPVVQATSARLAMRNLVRRPPAVDRQRAWVTAEELMVRAPPPRPPNLVPRRRPPGVARQQALVVAAEMMVRAPPPRPPALSVRLGPRAVAPKPLDRPLMQPPWRPRLPAGRHCRMLP